MMSGYERRDPGSEAAGTAVSAAKIRVYELAKEVGLAPKDMVAKIRSLGVEVGNHMSNLDGVDADRVRRAIERERQESLVEERLSDTVIRRRSRTAGAARPAPARTAALSAAATSSVIE
ncbi:MAG: translation initiation factor IF-2 N-terminal domain-containing protein, partial [Polyangia bacterium]